MYEWMYQFKIQDLPSMYCTSVVRSKVVKRVCGVASTVACVNQSMDISHLSSTSSYVRCTESSLGEMSKGRLCISY